MSASFDNMRAALNRLEDEVTRNEYRHEIAMRELAAYRDDLEKQVEAAIALIAAECDISPSTASLLLDSEVRRLKKVAS